MGYSPQKTPFDLADFLSKPGSPKARKWQRFSLGRKPAQPELPEDTATKPDEAVES
ncbi:MAG: hypothetical protein ACK4RZ_10305 [Paracoccaceae bacterium]